MTISGFLQLLINSFLPRRLKKRALKLIAHQDVALTAKPDLWRATGPHPIFALHEPSGVMPQGWVALSVDIQLLEGNLLYPAIYIDSGDGFREDRKIALAVSARKPITKIMEFPIDTVAIRFAPGDEALRYRIGRISVRPLSQIELNARMLVYAIESRRARGIGLAAIGRQAIHYLRRHGWKRLQARLMQSAEKADQHASYLNWIDQRAGLEATRLNQAKAELAHFTRKPVFSIVMPTYNTPQIWLSKAIQSVRAQIYPHWELCICDDASTDAGIAALLRDYAAQDCRIKVALRTTNGGIARATNDAMALMSGEYLCLMDHDDEITPNALFEFAKILNEDPSVDFIYSDEDKLNPSNERCEPFFKPDWSPTLLESCMYTSHLACYRHDLVEKIGGFRPEYDGAQDYDFVLRYAEQVRNVRHVRQILYHWRMIPGSTAQAVENKSYVVAAALRALTERCKRSGTVAFVRSTDYAGCFAVRRQLVGSPLVSIIVPSKRSGGSEGPHTLLDCVKTIIKTSTYRRFELIIVDEGNLDSKITRDLERVEARIVTAAQPVRKIGMALNQAAAQARGDYLLFLDANAEIISEDWLEAMLAAAQRPHIGIVGATLHAADGRLLHVGITSCAGQPGYLRQGYPEKDPGYFFSSICTREVLAVSASCMLLSAPLFGEVGGFDENFTANYHDVDLCIKIRKTGRSVVHSSQARLFLRKGAIFPDPIDASDQRLWNELLADDFADDPYYSSMLSITPPSFEPDFSRGEDRIGDRLAQPHDLRMR